MAGAHNMTDIATAPVQTEAGTPDTAQDRLRDNLGRFAPAKTGETASPGDESAATAAPAAEDADTSRLEETEKTDPRRERSRQRWQEMKSRVREAESTARYWREKAEQQMQEASKPIDPNQFGSDAEYQAALSAQAMRRVTAQDHAATAEAVAQQAQYAARAALDVQVQALRSHIPDIDVIYREPEHGGPQITQAMAMAINESENGALVAYHLARDSKRAESISRMSPIAAARALGMLEAELNAKPQRRISQAPQPVQTVSGGTGNPGVDLSSLSMSDYIKAREAGAGR